MMEIDIKKVQRQIPKCSPIALVQAASMTLKINAHPTLKKMLEKCGGISLGKV